jgi:hypothetical protein
VQGRVVAGQNLRKKDYRPLQEVVHMYPEQAMRERIKKRESGARFLA